MNFLKEGAFNTLRRNDLQDHLDRSILTGKSKVGKTARTKLYKKGNIHFCLHLQATVSEMIEIGTKQGNRVAGGQGPRSFRYI